MKSLPILIRALLQDCKRLLPGVVGLDRDEVTLLARFKNEGIGFLTVALPAFGKSFDQGLEEGWFTCPQGFAKRGAIPKLFSGMLCEVFDTKTGQLKEQPNVEYIKCVREILYFFKKFTPSDDRKKILETKAFDDFANLDSSIRSVAPFRLDRLAHVGKFTLEHLDMFNELKCKHGPGAVAEGVTPNQKWIGVTAHLLDFDETFNDAGYDVVSWLYHDAISEQSFSNIPRSSDCRLVAVPKTSTALRTITVEPLLNQFIQQGYNEHLRTCINKCAVLRRCLSLTDQTKNQDLALIGSLTGDWVTMDLSSASDLLSLEVVNAVFANRPRFLKGIMACRTPSVDNGNAIIQLKKYAGMGNATTFPVQSVCFATIALAAIVGNRRITKRRLEAYASCIRVYGDDIIVKREYYPSVAEWILSCGLKINRMKTFSKGNFRESCGVDAYKGVNVTPIYLRHDPDLASADPSSLVGSVSTANQLWLACRYSTARCLQRLIGKRLPLVERTSSALGWHTRQNAYNIERWNRHLHRFEVRSYDVSGKTRPDALDGIPALMKFFHSRQYVDRESSGYLPSDGKIALDHLERSAIRFRLKAYKRWLPA